MNNNKYDISSVKRVTGKFLEVLRCGRSKQRQSNLVPRGLFSGVGVGEKLGKAREKRPGDEVDGKEMYQKSVLHVQSCFFAN